MCAFEPLTRGRSTVDPHKQTHGRPFVCFTLFTAFDWWGNCLLAHELWDHGGKGQKEQESG